jgi:hypothetical protein
MKLRITQKVNKLLAAAFVLWVGTSSNGSGWDWDPNRTFTSLSDCTAQKKHEIDQWIAIAQLSDKNISKGLQTDKERTRVVDDTVFTYIALSETNRPIIYRYRCLPDTIDPREPQK